MERIRVRRSPFCSSSTRGSAHNHFQLQPVQMRRDRPLPPKRRRAFWKPSLFSGYLLALLEGEIGTPPTTKESR